MSRSRLAILSAALAAGLGLAPTQTAAQVALCINCADCYGDFHRTAATPMALYGAEGPHHPSVCTYYSCFAVTIMGQHSPVYCNARPALLEIRDAPSLTAQVIARLVERYPRLLRVGEDGGVELLNCRTREVVRRWAAEEPSSE